MATFMKFCVVVSLMIVPAWTGDSKSGPGSSETVCKTITLNSQRGGKDKKEIRDSRGYPADIVSVTVTNRLSREDCHLDENLVINEPFVIARDGCSAEIRVCYKEWSWSDSNTDRDCKVVRLLSRLNRDAEETLPDKIKSMKVVRLLSDRQCKEGRHYGYQDNRAYAKDGCRADFKVCFKDHDKKACREIVLKSTFGKRDHQVIDDKKGDKIRVVSLELIKEARDSPARCLETRTFYFSKHTVTAEAGCQGRFKVCYRKKNSKFDDDDDDDDDDDEDRDDRDCTKIKLLSTLNNSARKQVADDPDDIKSIRLVRNFGSIQCERRKNYGIRGKDVFATGGCRGEFKVCKKNRRPSDNDPGQTCVNVFLRSSPNEPDWKKVTGPGGSAIKIKSLRLVSQDSETECLIHRNFYVVNPDEVYAKDGCRGKFRVCY